MDQFITLKTENFHFAILKGQSRYECEPAGSLGQVAEANAIKGNTKKIGSSEKFKRMFFSILLLPINAP